CTHRTSARGMAKPRHAGRFVSANGRRREPALGRWRIEAGVPERHRWLAASYAIDANGGTPQLLTPGNFMVEDVVMAPDARSIVYTANTGATKNDNDRRHLFRVPADRAQPVALTSGSGIQTSPAAAGSAIAYIDAGAQRPPLVSVMHANGSGKKALQADLIPKDFPTAQLVIPQAVTFKAADGTEIQGQLFRSAEAGANQPGMIFVHGGPPRQMLLGWHYMDY